MNTYYKKEDVIEMLTNHLETEKEKMFLYLMNTDDINLDELQAIRDVVRERWDLLGGDCCLLKEYNLKGLKR